MLWTNIVAEALWNIRGECRPETFSTIVTRKRRLDGRTLSVKGLSGMVDAALNIRVMLESLSSLGNACAKR